MFSFTKPSLERPHSCGYLRDRDARFKSFIAMELSEEELEGVLSKGWRKFGPYYFKPACHGCKQCVPIRVLAQEFVPSKSQRRLLRKNAATVVRFSPLSYQEEIFAIYQEHSHDKFGQGASWENFIGNFYTPSCPSFQSEYYINGELAAVGFLDRSSRGLSSVYFIYRTKHSHLGLGNFSILKEIEYTASLNLKYYYLGYYVAECHSMLYKNHFYPHEKYDWRNQKWYREEHPEEEDQQPRE